MPEQKPEYRPEVFEDKGKPLLGPAFDRIIIFLGNVAKSEEPLTGVAHEWSREKINEMEVALSTKEAELIIRRDNGENVTHEMQQVTELKQLLEEAKAKLDLS